jgi:multiple sugar transport system permease protein
MWKFVARQLLLHTLLMGGAVLMLLPFGWMCVTSLKPPNEIFSSTITFWPSRMFALQNYGAALGDVPLGRFMLNGAIVCIVILACQVAVSLPCAYALAKLEFRGKSLLLGLVLVSLLIPIQVPALPLYLAFARLGFLDSYAALILPFTSSAFAIFLLRQFFKSYPDEILNAARLDGFGELAIVWKIVLPSAWPAIAAFSVFSVVSHWNDLYWPLIVVSSKGLATPPLGLMLFRQDSQSMGNVGALMAGGTLIIAPLVVAFLFAQRSFVRGITMTGVK